MVTEKSPEIRSITHISHY